MKIETKVPDILTSYLETEHEKALRSMFHGKDFAMTLPMHTSNFALLNDDNTANYQIGNTKIKKVIIPPLNIYINKRLIKDNMIPRNGIEYRIKYNNQPFPIAHVYGDSGYLCLGNIFVPSYVPLYSPQTPLETLFLHNDRYIAHGHPKLIISKKDKQYIYDYVENKLNTKINIPIDKDWIRHDTLWRISNLVFEESKNTKESFEIMENVFKIVFKQNTNN